jgi:transposase
MRKISEVLRLRFDLKCTHREIARALNVSPATISDCLARTKAAGLEWPLPGEMSEQELYDRVFLPVPRGQKVRPLPDWDWVTLELRKKAMTLTLIWREYRETHPDGLGYTQFCVRYREHVKQISPVMRQVHKAGEKVFIDYAGMTVPWIDVSTGEIREAQIYVASLGASQYTFAQASPSQQLPDWIESHIQMWEFFGGVSQVVVPDNLKSGVTKAHRYDPDINANYQRIGEHYGFAIVPARPAAPKDKGKVENAVGCIERQILAALRHHTFTSIGEINRVIKPLLDKFNSQSFQKMKTSRRELFETIDKPALKPLPERYQFAQWSRAKVNIDYHIVFEEHYYSVPHQYIHHKIELRVTAKSLECFYQNKRIAIHLRSHERFKHSTVHEHMPIAHQEHAQWTPERIKRWACKIGPNTGQFIEHMIASRPFPEQAFRACLGVLRLAKSFGEARLEKACAIGLEVGANRYKQIESILKNKMDILQAVKNVPTPIIESHENIRGPHYYQN